MKKWKGALFIVVTVIVALLISVGADILYGYVAHNKITPEKAQPLSIEFIADNIYLGNKVLNENGEEKSQFDVRSVLGLSDKGTLKINEKDILSNDTVNFSDYDIKNTKVTVNDREVTLIDGVNILSAQDFWAYKSQYAYLKNNVVLQRDIDLNTLENIEDNFRFKVDKNFYGNGKKVVSFRRFNGKRRHFALSFEFCGYGQKIFDTRFTGRVIAPDEELILDDFLYYGVPVQIGNNSESTDKTKADFTNCLFENSYRNAYVTRSDVTFDRCIFNNSAESNVSIKTTTGHNSNVTFKSCILLNATVANVTNWCEGAVTEENFCTINVENTRFYSWKSTENARIMVEDSDKNLYTIVNPMFQSVINSGDAKKNFVKYKDNYYASTAIIVICSGGGKNETKINGLAENHLQRLPIPDNNVLSLFLSYAQIYGYPDASYIKPDEKPLFAF